MAPRVRRVDTPEPIALAPPDVSPSGFLRAEGRAARVGIQIYYNPDGSERRELRLPEEVGAPASLASARGVPVTNTHPDELVTPETARTLARGAVLDVAWHPDEGWIVAPIVVHDREAQEAIRQGRRQLSVGYTCDLDDSPPDPALVAKWGKYDAIQREIRWNHLALVDEARAGAAAALRLDARGDAIGCVIRSEAQAPPDPAQETQPMAHILKVDGRTIEITDATAPLIQAEIDKVAKRADEATASAAKLKGAIAKLVATHDAIRARRDAMKARMIPCDECGGTGKIGEGDAAPKCDYCDGAKMIRMHDAIKVAIVPEASAEGEEIEEAEGDAIDEVKAAAEGAEPKHVDAARRKADTIAAHAAAHKALVAKRDAARAKRDAAIVKQAADRAATRAKLEEDARRVLGADAKLDGVADDDVRRQAITKAQPTAKLDGASAEYLRARFDAVIEALPAPTAQPSAADRMRAATITPAAGTGATAAPRGPNGSPYPATPEGAQAARQAFIADRAGAWKTLTPPTTTKG